MLFKQWEKQADAVLHLLWLLVQVCSPRQRLDKRINLVQIVRKCEGFSNLGDALIWKANHGPNQSVADVRTHPWIVAAVMKCLIAMSIAPIKRKSAHNVVPCVAERTRHHKVRPQQRSPALRLSLI